MQQLLLQRPFQLENGQVLPELLIGFNTYGQLNSQADNVVWICHAFTGNAEASDWWAGLVGPGKVLDPERYFIVCANMLGSCYGSSGPCSLNPQSGRFYKDTFPEVTVRDIVRAHIELRRHLQIERIHLVIGGSMGGQQALEWAVMEAGLFEHLVILASNAQHSPWGVAFNEAQRMAIEGALASGNGKAGLEAARAIGMLSYRHYNTYQATQGESDPAKIGNYRAASYQRYQGEKLWGRFDLYSYLILSKAMDSHHLGRGRGGVDNALRQIQARTLIFGITTDLLFPLSEQRLLAKHITKARLIEIESPYGHDGFLVEFEAIGRYLRAFLNGLPVGISFSSGNGKTAFVSAGHLPPLPGTEPF